MAAPPAQGLEPPAPKDFEGRGLWTFPQHASRPYLKNALQRSKKGVPALTHISIALRDQTGLNEAHRRSERHLLLLTPKNTPYTLQ